MVAAEMQRDHADFQATRLKNCEPMPNTSGSAALHFVCRCGPLDSPVTTSPISRPHREHPREVDPWGEALLPQRSHHPRGKQEGPAQRRPHPPGACQDETGTRGPGCPAWRLSGENGSVLLLKPMMLQPRIDQKYNYNFLNFSTILDPSASSSLWSCILQQL